MAKKNPYEKALDAVWDAHDCDPIGRVTAGDLRGAHSSIAVCGDEACRAVSTAYVTATGLTPVEFVPYERD